MAKNSESTEREGMAGVRGRQDVLVALEAAQRRLGYLPAEVMLEFARGAGVSLGEVYGVASFYSFLSTRPLGRHVVRVCKSVPCHLKEMAAIAQGIEKELGIRPGETTADGRFSFQTVNCIGACDGSPAIMVNDDLHVKVTPDTLAGILKNYP